MKLSIVTTLFCSAPYLPEFYRRICSAAEKITSDFEIVFVNDGSPDNSLELAVSLYEKDRRVKIVDLSRNFGQHKAIMTGLAQAQGDLVFLVDCDLEEEPELLGKFHEKLLSSRADVVYGVQLKRKGNYFEKISGAIFYHLFNFLSGYPIPKNILTARLMVKRYVECLVEHKDREVFIAGLWAITGFNQIPLAVQKLSKGTSAYSFRKKVSLLLNSVTSFSNKPLMFIFYLGFFISFISGISALYLIAKRVLFGVFLVGWPSIIVSIWLLGGLILFCIGILGIYLSKIFMETKPRPYTVIKRIYPQSDSR